MSNPLAYWASSSVTKEKSFITLTADRGEAGVRTPSRTGHESQDPCLQRSPLISFVTSLAFYSKKERKKHSFVDELIQK